MIFMRPFSVWLRRESDRRRQLQRDRQAEARHLRACAECRKQSPDEELVKRRSGKLEP